MLGWSRETLGEQLELSSPTDADVSSVQGSTSGRILMTNPLYFAEEHLPFKLAMEAVQRLELLVLLSGPRFLRMSGSPRSSQHCGLKAWPREDPRGLQVPNYLGLYSRLPHNFCRNVSFCLA